LFLKVEKEQSPIEEEHYIRRTDIKIVLALLAVRFFIADNYVFFCAPNDLSKGLFPANSKKKSEETLDH